MDLFLLAPAFQAIYGRPMAYIQDRTAKRPSSVFLFQILLALPFISGVVLHLLSSSDVPLYVGIGVQVLLAPLYLAVPFKHVRLGHRIDDEELVQDRAVRKIRDQTVRDYREKRKPKSVILNK